MAGKVNEGTTHANEKNGQWVIQDKDRTATHVVVDGMTYNVHRQAGDKA